jgi:hypothetical protein
VEEIPITAVFRSEVDQPCSLYRFTDRYLESIELFDRAQVVNQRAQIFYYQVIRVKIADHQIILAFNLGCKGHFATVG